MTMSKLPDLQSAVRRIDGVAAATVRWPDPRGPATLRVEFAADADRVAVTEAVIATLNEVAGVDVNDIRLDMHPEQGAAHVAQSADEPDETEVPASSSSDGAGVPAEGDGEMAADEHNGAEDVQRETFSAVGTPLPQTNGRARPVFSGMTIDRGDLDTRVHVTLAVGHDAYTGMAEGLATRRATPRTAAMATLGALHDLLPQGMRVQLEWMDILEPSETGRPSIVQAAITCLSREGEQVYIGTAIVRTDLREAAVRATLDALNRQLFRWRDAVPVAVPA